MSAEGYKVSTVAPQRLITKIPRTLEMLELFYTLLAYPFIFALCIALLKIRVFHKNLSTLLINIQLTEFVCLLTRSILILMNIDPMFSSVADFIQKLNNSMMFSLAIVVVVIVIERAVATLMVRTYETFCSSVPYFALAAIIIQWAVCITTMIHYHNQKLPPFMMAMIIYGCHGFAMLIFLILPYISRYIVQKQKKSHNLSVRYQSVENARSANLLRVVILIFALLAGIGNTCILLLTVIPKHEPMVHFMCIWIYNTTVPTAAILVTVISFYKLPNLFDGFLKFLTGRNIRTKICCRRVNKDKPEIKMNAVAEGNMYFEIFSNAWK